MERTLALCLIAVFMLTGSPPGLSTARAEDYAEPTYENLVKALVRFGAVNVADNDILDNYARLMECKLYKKFYMDDFQWKQFRTALRQSIKQNIASFPTSFRYEAVLQFGRYDFKKKIYNFTEKTEVRNYNMFELKADRAELCDTTQMNLFPGRFNLVLDEPIYFLGIPLPEEAAQTLLKRMDESGNKDHFVYTNFNLRVVYIARFYREKDKKGNRTGRLRQETKGGETRFDVRLDSVDFYEDEKKTRLIYSFRQ